MPALPYPPSAEHRRVLLDLAIQGLESEIGGIEDQAGELTSDDRAEIASAMARLNNLVSPRKQAA